MMPNKDILNDMVEGRVSEMM